jgi:hypothetical protein
LVDKVEKHVFADGEMIGHTIDSGTLPEHWTLATKLQEGISEESQEYTKQGLAKIMTIVNTIS